MPKAQLVAAELPQAPLTVAAVSVRLGISPSTLRTWERRYGIGNEERQSGTRRRYLPDDFARLAHMVELIHAGVPTAEAAAIVRGETPAKTRENTRELPVPSHCDDILAAAQGGRAETLIRLLENAIATHGLVYTWTHLLEPALESIRASTEGEKPGYAPSALLTLAVLQVLTEISDQRPTTSTDQENTVGILILTDEEHSLAAHVMGVALQWREHPTAIMSTGNHGGTEVCDRIATYMQNHDVRIAVVTGRGTACEKLVTTLIHDHSTDVILVGADTPPILNPKVLRVRTIAAAVEETLARI
ncbi:MerR family transcriptional regulator [Schaalia sp. lx-100]|uniref:MerR family transcriptional regulator n=1 Tax=Schaalia sp. lx-100 TaxID=2899081 RepID=UPI001E5177F4|nr:MerR family transcriptional regulator [Schaalia sp. lx-100]MCD4556822.1 MerR family transcriptional regulator [Schaalia sp. lx-100]